MTLTQKITLALGVLIGGGLWLATTVFASDFTADYKVDYTLHPDQEVIHVKQQVALTNKQSNLRASSYSLTLDSNSYTNLRAYDSSGDLDFTEAPADGTTTITFTFNDRVVGTGNALRWTIEYDSSSLAKHHGQLWDIAIPRIEEHESYEITSYEARLLMPESIGEAHYISPVAASTAAADGYNIYTFQKEQIFPAGIVAAFGQAQVFEFTLKYHLHNPNIGQASTEIALPPDVPGQQQIIYNELSPKPVSIRTDEDGNSLATYYLGPNKSLDVTFTGWARIDARYPTLTSDKRIDAIPADLVKNYTVEQRYWETSDADLIKKVEEITDPNKPAVENARAIYNYVTSTLQYNTARINKDLERMGAAAAFDDPDNAVCMEFTDLFVTMARIAGIPAREIDGYAYTTDNDNHPIFYPGLGSDILHAWAQIYLPDDGWVMVDPTWGSTTGGIDFFGRIDLNRIAFAIRGVDSQSPYAAGSYKTNDQQDGDVKVSFSDQSKDGQPSLAMELDRLNVTSGLGGSLPLKITNTGNVALYNVATTVEAQKPLIIGDTANLKLPRLLPGQTATVWLPAETEGWFDQAKTTLGVKVTSDGFYQDKTNISKDFTVEVQPFLAAVVLPITLLIAGILAITAGAWYGLHRLHHRSNLPSASPETTT